MISEYRNESIIDAFNNGDIDILAHQVNCFVVGAGVARVIRQAFPRSIRKEDKCEYGDIFVTPYSNGDIIEMATQYFPGSCRENTFDDIDYRKFKLIEALVALDKCYHNKVFGFPLVQSGLACDVKLKGSMTDLEYFQKYIAECFNVVQNNKVIIYYI